MRGLGVTNACCRLPRGLALRFSNHLVGAEQQVLWYMDSHLPRRTQVDDQVVLGHLFDGQVGWFPAPEYLVNYRWPAGDLFRSSSARRTLARRLHGIPYTEKLQGFWPCVPSE
jgi:hypothetical protein